jgi:hypothetical protein
MNKFKLVKCNSDYYQFIRELRTHPENISGFISQRMITEEEQNNYMKINEKFYFICLYENVPAGFVGVIDDDIRVATKPEFKKKGVAKFMIDEIMKIYPSANAKIKFDNSSSLSLFESCGFKPEFIIMKK